MPLNMKVYISTGMNVLDVNEKLLPSGKHFFLVQEFSKNNTVTGNIIKSNGVIVPYEFRYFSFLLMTVKAQAVLARKANITDNRMPKFSSPKMKKKTLSQTPVVECTICLLSIRSRLSSKTLKCGHKFHRRCISKWARINKSCPNCRASLDSTHK